MHGRVHSASRSSGASRARIGNVKYDHLACGESSETPTAWAPTPLSAVASGAYLATFLVFLVVVFFSIAEPTAPLTSVGGIDIPAGARCLRSSRHADFSSVWLPIGAPVRNAQLLLRLDRVVKNPLDALSIKGTLIAQSTSKVCNVSSSRCTDVVQVGGRLTDQVKNEMTDFHYFSGLGDTSLAGAYLGLDGELALVAGVSYWLTTSHLCWSNSNESSSSGTTADVTVDPVSRALMASTDEGLGPVGCNATTAALFPAWASSELRWLALTSTFLYEHAEDTLRGRRRTVEQAGVCNGETHTDQYWSDCRGSPAGCQSTPSIPYRRLGAMHSLYLSLDADGLGGRLAHVRTAALERVPVLMSTDSANIVATLRLVLMVLVAGVTYIRSSQEGTKSERLVLSAWRWYYGLPVTRSCSNTTYDIISTAVTGLLALAGRVVVVLAMAKVLRNDGQGLLVASEIVGCLVSGAHLLARQMPFLELNTQRETALTLYGGPMALIDVTCSMLTVFAETPLLGTRASFATVGRMLAAILLSINCINISVFAVVACAIKGASPRAESSDGSKTWHCLYRLLHVLGGALWLAQTGCVAVTFCTAFVQPFSWSLMRVHTGAWRDVRFAIAAGFVATSVPVQNRVLLDVVRTTTRGGSESETKAD